MAISLPAGSGSARNLASRSRQKAEFVSIAPFAIHQEVRLRPVHDTGARRELGDYPNISRRELPLLREELGASGADFCRGLIVALFCPKRRPFWDIGIAEQPRGPPSLSWGEERTKILLLACCYQEVAPAVASRDGDCGVERVAGRSGEVRQAGGPTSRLHAGHGAGAGGATVRRVPAATRKSPIGCGKVRTNRRGWLHL